MEILTTDAFDTHVVWSANDVLGDSDDVAVVDSATSFTGLATRAWPGRVVRKRCGVRCRKFTRAKVWWHQLFAHYRILNSHVRSKAPS